MKIPGAQDLVDLGKSDTVLDDHPPSSSRRATLRDLLKSVAAKSGLSAEILLRKAQLGSVVNARDRFIRDAVLKQGYLASQVASFLNSHPSNISRALQRLSRVRQV